MIKKKKGFHIFVRNVMLKYIQFLNKFTKKNFSWKFQC